MGSWAVWHHPQPLAGLLLVLGAPCRGFGLEWRFLHKDLLVAKEMNPNSLCLDANGFGGAGPSPAPLPAERVRLIHVPSSSHMVMMLERQCQGGGIGWECGSNQPRAPLIDHGRLEELDGRQVSGGKGQDC